MLELTGGANRMSKSPRVDIAMATYNGAAFLSAQLESLARQSYKDIFIYISDDGSTDDTLNIIQGASELVPLCLVRSSSGRSIIRNFEDALVATKAPYVALSDQDDVWHSDKISLLYDKIVELEGKFGKETPLIVYSDLEIVDEHLNTILNSYFASSLKSSSATDFRDFVLNNHVPGCAMLMNRALVELALPFPSVDIHDHWLMQVATLFGRVAYLDQPLVKYRQHQSNSIGLARIADTGLDKLGRIISRLPHELRNRRKRWVKQAASVRENAAWLRSRFDSRLSFDQKLLLDSILSCTSSRQFRKILRGARTGERWVDFYGVSFALSLREGL